MPRINRVSPRIPPPIMQSMRHNVGRWMREAQLHKHATESMQYCAHRGMAVRNSRGRVKDDAVGASAVAEAPELRATMRKLAFLVHPDRFAGMPDAAKENEASLAFLQGLLSTVQKDKENHPPAAIKRLRFHVHQPDGTSRLVEQQVKTTGGNCRNLVEKSLAQLFTKLNLEPSFRWGADDWSLLNAPKTSPEEQH